MIILTFLTLNLKLTLISSLFAFVHNKWRCYFINSHIKTRSTCCASRAVWHTNSGSIREAVNFGSSANVNHLSDEYQNSQSLLLWSPNFVEIIWLYVSFSLFRYGFSASCVAATVSGLTVGRRLFVLRARAFTVLEASSIENYIQGRRCVYTGCYLRIVQTEITRWRISFETAAWRDLKLTKGATIRNSTENIKAADQWRLQEALWYYTIP